jgi:hypothetical protein
MGKDYSGGRFHEDGRRRSGQKTNIWLTNVQEGKKGCGIFPVFEVRKESSG